MMTEEEATSGNILFWGSTDPKDPPLCAPHQFSSIIALDICNGSKFTAILADDGFCYTTGNPSWYNGTEPIDDIKCWEELREVKKIACGVNFMAALTSFGTVYTWGHGTFGQLGIGEDINKYPQKVVSTPTLISTINNITDISCGSEFMAALSKDGHLYTWGKGSCGCLGHGNDKDLFVPVQVTALSEEIITQVKCGTTHMACITENKEIFTWGNNFLGQLGRIIDKHKDVDPIPRSIELVQVGQQISIENLKRSDEFSFIQIECLEFNTIALTSNGKLFSCGKGGPDGSGHGDNPHYLLCLLEKLPPIISISSSWTSHVAAIANNGEVYTWGNNELGQLGLGDTESKTVPCKMDINELKLLKISCGETHTTALIDLHSLLNEQTQEQVVEKLIEKPVEKIIEKIIEKPVEKPIEKPIEKTIEKNNSVSIISENTSEKKEVTKSVIKKEPKIESKSFVAPKEQDKKKIQGYLNKKGEKGLVKSYKKRWFQIENDIISYYDKPEGQLKGFIYIIDILDVLPSQVKYGINIVTSKKRVYELHAFSEQDKQMWWQALKEILKKK